MSHPHFGAPTGVAPAIVLVAGPESADRMYAEFAKRYERDYDLRPAGTADEAEQVIRQINAEGIPIAMVATLPQLPDAGYEDLLGDVHPLCPSSCRLLVLDWTTFSELERSRLYDSVSEGVIDAYLGLPRGPRDEEFHAAVAELLSEWGWSAHGPEVETVQIVAVEFTPELMRLKDVLARMGIPYRKYAVDSEVGREIVDEAGPGAPLPLVRTKQGTLSNPTLAQLSALMYGGPADVPTDFVADLVVLGAGPAGLGAAVYGASEGLSTVVVESEAVGGQAGTSSMIRNYLGFPRGISGMRLTQRARFQATRFGARFIIGHAVAALTPSRDGAPHVITLDSGDRLRARSVVIATGAEYRKLGVESVESLVGRGVYYGAAMSVAQGLRDAKVFIVGGGNSAGQAAVYMSRFTSSVTLLVRRPSLTETMSDYLIREVEANPRITVRTCTEVVDGGDSPGREGRLAWLQLRDTRTARENRVRAGALLLLLGADPCSRWLGDQVAVDDRSFVLTGRDVPHEAWPDSLPPSPHATSAPGVFAVGDVRSGSMKRVASASGEGASVVPAVHAWLTELDAVTSLT